MATISEVHCISTQRKDRNDEHPERYMSYDITPSAETSLGEEQSWWRIEALGPSPVCEGQGNYAESRGVGEKMRGRVV